MITDKEVDEFLQSGLVTSRHQDGDAFLMLQWLFRMQYGLEFTTEELVRDGNPDFCHERSECGEAWRVTYLGPKQPKWRPGEPTGDRGLGLVH